VPTTIATSAVDRLPVVALWVNTRATIPFERA
jgi:hypothetical protein